MQSSTWAYPAVETAHILALGILIGSAAMWDFRLLGFFKRLEIQDFQISVLGVARKAFFFAVVTGILLFLTNPVEMFQNISFRFKLLFILLAMINIAVFHLTLKNRMAYGFQGKVHAVVSLILWALVVTSGRWIAYV